MNSRQPSLIRSRLILIGIVALIVIAGAVWVFGPNAPSRSLSPTPTLAPAPQITFTPPPDLGELAKQFPRLEKLLTNPALDSAYKDFLVAYESGGVEAAELLARQRGLLSDDNQIRVTLVLDTEDSTALVTELTDIGVIVRGTYRDLIDIGVPLELIAKTAESDNPGAIFDRITQLEHVIGLQLPTPKPAGAQARRSQPANLLAGFLLQARPHPDLWSPLSNRPLLSIREGRPEVGMRQQPPLSEGVATIGLPAWHATGYTGQGVKIGVLDQGFDGYRDLLGTRLPLSLTVQSFVPGTAVDGTGLTHGTAVAEIIHAAAPDAELYLAHYDGGDVSMGNAVDWLMQQGVSIISHSAGGLAAPMDGTGRDAELADQVAAAGLIWINSAGNAANQHYRGDFADSNGDLIHEFAPDKTTLGFQSDPAGLTQIILNWNDWGKGGVQDLDLFLLDADGNIIASSRNTRDSDRPPVEQILFQFDDSRTYFLTINSVNVSQPLRLDVYIHQTSNLEMADPNGSLATPADARGSLTVGAAYWRTDELEPFSSRGPTADGRIKPDLVGPDGVLSDIFAPDRFFGTSAAAPHITGAAAVVWSAFPSATADEIRQYLTTNAIDLMDPGVDAATGAGRLLLPAPPAAPTITPVPINTPVSNDTPSPVATTAPNEPPPTAPPSIISTPTPPRIATRPRPPVQPPATENGGWIGLIAIGLAAVLAGVAGWRLTRRPDRSAAPSTRSIDAAPAACLHCGRTLPADAVFCAQCGRPVGALQTVTRCAHCGRALRPGAKYCARCGHAASASS